MKPRVFYSDLTDRYYYSTRYKDLGNGNFETGRKIDVTEDVKSFIESALERERVRMAKLFEGRNK